MTPRRHGPARPRRNGMGRERATLLDPAEGRRARRVEVQPVPGSFRPRYDAGKPGRKDLNGDAFGTATPGGFSPTTERGTRELPQGSVPIHRLAVWAIVYAGGQHRCVPPGWDRGVVSPHQRAQRWRECGPSEGGRESRKTPTLKMTTTHGRQEIRLLASSSERRHCSEFRHGPRSACAGWRLRR